MSVALAKNFKTAYSDFLDLESDNIDQKDSNGETLTMWAIKLDNAHALYKLLKKKADIGASRYGNGLMHYAAQYARIAPAFILNKFGADLLIKNMEGLVPRDVAITEIEKNVNTECKIRLEMTARLIKAMEDIEDLKLQGKFKVINMSLDDFGIQGDQELHLSARRGDIAQCYKHIEENPFATKLVNHNFQKPIDIVNDKISKSFGDEKKRLLAVRDLLDIADSFYDMQLPSAVNVKKQEFKSFEI